MRNNDVNVQVFQNRNPRYSPKSVRQFFFVALTVRKKKEKKYGDTDHFLRKRKPWMQNLTKEWKQPPVVILQQLIF